MRRILLTSSRLVSLQRAFEHARNFLIFDKTHFLRGALHGATYQRTASPRQRTFAWYKYRCLNIGRQQWLAAEHRFRCENGFARPARTQPAADRR